MSTYIYVLVEPDTLDIRYVGKTVSPGSRLYGHVYDAKLGKRARRFIWIRSLINRDLLPFLQIIEEVADDEDWRPREKFWIKHLRDLGCGLVNGTDGGDGALNCVRDPWDEAAKGRHSVRIKSAWDNSDQEFREFHRQRTLEGITAWKSSERYDDFLQKLSDSSTRLWQTEEYRIQQREVMYARWSDPAARENHSRTMKQIVWPEEMCPSCGMQARVASMSRHKCPASERVFRPVLREEAQTLVDLIGERDSGGPVGLLGRRRAVVNYCVYLHTVGVPVVEISSISGFSQSKLVDMLKNHYLRE